MAIIQGYNHSFEDGWTDLPPGPNYLINQRPNKWTLNIIPIGENLYDSQDKATGIPECVHKNLDTLPPDEHPGQPNALILDGENTYKIFNSGASFGAELTQLVTGLKPNTTAVLTVPVLVDRPRSVNDPWHTEVFIAANGAGAWHNGNEQKQKEWIYHKIDCTVDEGGRIAIVIRVKSKWPLEAAFFIDAIELDAIPSDTTPPPEPPPDEIEARLAALEVRMTSNEIGLSDANDALTDHEQRIEALENPEPPPALKFPFLAVDLSGWNNLTASEWDKLKVGGVQLAMIRSSNGIYKNTDTTNAKGEDKLFWSHMNNARKRGIMTAITHFYNKNWDTEQIDHWKTILKEAVSSGFKIEFITLNFENTSPNIEGLIFNGCKAVRDRCSDIAPLKRQKIYTGDWWWNPRVSKSSQWPKQFGVWAGAYVSNDPIDTPPQPNKTWRTPHSWTKKDVWQFTSKGGSIFGLDRNLDVNWVFSLDSIPDPPPSKPTYKTADFMIPDPRAWVVVDRGPAGGENVYTIFENGREKRIKNEKQMEVYEWRNGAPWRIKDTSPSDDPQYGPCLYKQTTNGTPGGQIAPALAEEGVTYSYKSDVQFYRKSDCKALDYRSGKDAPSTFILVRVEENFTFGNGFTVDRLYVTTQTGETQLYGIKDGIKMGWIGGGAAQSGNTWTAVPIEFYTSRNINQTPPPGYC